MISQLAHIFLEGFFSKVLLAGKQYSYLYRRICALTYSFFIGHGIMLTPIKYLLMYNIQSLSSFLAQNAGMYLQKCRVHIAEKLNTSRDVSEKEEINNASAASTLTTNPGIMRGLHIRRCLRIRGISYIYNQTCVSQNGCKPTKSDVM
ncbi:hypothetical protein FCM35_KLT09720 [Carex littledalei]|uniref:Uncharacterized protein n=1 Tax=Carex littledalei TaxID=544730 RepID=A0A833RKN4_9POAL|nr:hypothetical protein FCM35_KLT09720 [Carex littledalei]